MMAAIHRKDETGLRVTRSQRTIAHEGWGEGELAIDKIHSFYLIRSI
jgi:hypothetical protein